MTIPLSILPVGSARYMDEDGNIRNLADLIEPYGLTMIDTVHDQVHEGKIFTASKRYVAVADDAVVYFRIKSGDNYSHFSFSVTPTGKAYIDTYIGTTYTADGTAALLVNRNTTIGLDAPTTAVYHTPTVNVLGTKRFEDLIPGGTSPQTRAGSVGSYQVETKLAPDQDLLIAAQNKSGAAIDISFVVNFYESEN